MTASATQTSTKLLVSVRNLAEATIASAADIDILDFKEPDNGSLGAVSATELAHVLDCLNPTIDTSCAIGELIELQPEDVVDYLRIADPNHRLRFVKVGTAGALDKPDWQRSWTMIKNCIPAPTELVAVTYADFHTCRAPAPDQLLALAQQQNCSTILIDTFEKVDSNLLDYFSEQSLRQLCNAAQKRGNQICIAGSIMQNQIPQLLRISPNYIGVRSAVCKRRNRRAEICEAELHNFVQKMKFEISVSLQQG